MQITTNCGKFLEIGISNHLTCLLRNCIAGQEATVINERETMDWLKIGKGVCQDCTLSPCLFNLYAESIKWNARLDEAQVGIKISGRNINISGTDDITNGRKQRGTKEPLDEGETREWKSWLKLNIEKNEIMTFIPIAFW